MTIRYAYNNVYVYVIKKYTGNISAGGRFNFGYYRCRHYKRNWRVITFPNTART